MYMLCHRIMESITLDRFCAYGGKSTKLHVPNYSCLGQVRGRDMTTFLLCRGQAIHNAKIELQNVETENRVLKDALAK